MLAGSDLVMTMLAVMLAYGFVMARGRSLPGAADDLDAYNTYLAALGRGPGRT